MLQVGAKSLLIDCGMFQGSKTEKALNYQPFPFDAAKLDAVLLTHAHIDHSGLLPKLMRAGFKGPIYATPGTRELCGFLLPDSGGIQEMEVEQLNRRNQRQRLPEVTPIYTKRDAFACLDLFRAAQLNQWTQIVPGVRGRWWNAGHILGAASIEVELTDGGATQRLLFSGDIGAGNSEFTEDPAGPAGVDHIVMESTYGDSVRDFLSPEQRQQKLIAELQQAHAAGGPLLIPAFAVERTQELVIDLLHAMNSGLAPRGPIFVDSPLAIRAMDAYLKYGRDDDGSNPFKDLRESNWLQFTESVDESKNIARFHGWHVIVSSSGMCDAGRVRHHLKRLLWNQNATVMLVGYQAIGTLGRMLRDGKKTVRMMGEEINVAARIRGLDIYSGHADANGLIDWVKKRAPITGSVFLIHGEPESRTGFQARLIADGVVGDRVIAPALDQSYLLRPGKAATPEAEKEARIAPNAPARLDWHNARAEFITSLSRKLDAAKSDAERETLLAALSVKLGTD
jgi:metallo-beta-lactamase family protein